MTLDQYSEQAYKNVIENSQSPMVQRLTYYGVCLGEECGELLGKIKRIVRDQADDIITPEFLDSIKKEFGDVIWYLNALRLTLGLEWDDILQTNIDKLNKRAKEDKITGSGDSR